VVERYRMIDADAAKEAFARDAKQHNIAPGMRNPNAQGKYLQLQFTVEDKNVFAMPWSATMTYGHGGGNAPRLGRAGLRRKYQVVPGQGCRCARADKADF